MTKDEKAERLRQKTKGDEMGEQKKREVQEIKDACNKAINTCKACLHYDVCKYREDYAGVVEEYKRAIVQRPECFEIEVKCVKYINNNTCRVIERVRKRGGDD